MISQRSEIEHDVNLRDCYCDTCIATRHRSFRRKFWAFVGTAILVGAMLNVAFGQTPPPRTATLTFVAPATYEDGSPFDCNAVNCSYSVYRGTCSSTTKTRVANGIRGASSVNVPNSVPGQCFTMTTVVGTAESAHSPEVRYRGSVNAPTITVVVTVAVEAQP